MSFTLLNSTLLTEEAIRLSLRFLTSVRDWWFLRDVLSKYGKVLVYLSQLSPEGKEHIDKLW
jgi:hypothetical protein